MPGGEFDATASWSGYIYQGKVALLHALKVINENFDEDLSNYSLEIEWMEDFAIKIGDEYLSVHQVKAYKNSTPGTYKIAIENLFNKINIDRDIQGYLHIRKEIDFSDIIHNFEELKYRYKPEDVEGEVIAKVHLYQYNDTKSFCGLDEVNALLWDEVEAILMKDCFSLGQRTDNQYDNVIIHLYKLIDEHIINRHNFPEDDDNKNRTIRFDEIKEIFHQNYEEPSQEYFGLKIKLYIEKMICEFCENPILCPNINCNNECNLFSIIKDIVL